MHTKPLHRYIPILPTNATSYIINYYTTTTYYIHTGDTYLREEGIVVIITILKGLVPQDHLGVILPQENRNLLEEVFFLASLGDTPLQGVE